MRRLRILLFWVFKNKNNVSFNELLQFLVKPTIDSAQKNIKHLGEDNDKHIIEFYSIAQKLYWPKAFSLKRLYQVMTETFDSNDWHYYQKEHTVIEDGEILLDIGTAEGLFPLTVIDKCEHVYMVEPGKIFYDCLEKTFEAYTSKITLLNSAVGNEDGEINFDEDSLDGKISQSHGTTRVSIRKIDTLLNNNEKITYLKADIEGFEQEMLKGAEQTIKRNKPKIAITTYHTENDPNEIIGLIKGFVPEYNYYVKGIYEETPKPVLIHFWI